MRMRKHERERKRKHGQYMTPLPLARKIVSGMDAGKAVRILEPSCGDGAFIYAVMEELSDRSGTNIEIVGVEIDPILAKESQTLIQRISLPGVALKTEVKNADFFAEYLNATTIGSDGQGGIRRESFDLIIGNPPFGGTFDRSNRRYSRCPAGPSSWQEDKEGDLFVLHSGLHRPASPRRSASIRVQRPWQNR